MSFYGNKLNEDILFEQQILQEMHFSKKDLQDPKTLDKILKKKEQFDSVNKFLDFLFTILTIACGIGTKILGVGFFSGLSLTGLISIYIHGCLKSMSVKSLEKNNKKYNKKCKQLIEKMEKLIKKDPKNKNKYQEVINNCNKVLQEMDRRKKETENKKFMGIVDSYIEMYEALIDWLEEPKMIGTKKDYCFDLAKELKISESILIDKIKEIDFKISFKKLKLNNIKGCNLDTNEDFIAVKFFNNYYVFYSLKSNKLFEINLDNKDHQYKELTPYELANYKFDNKALIEADKEMGYYILSDCPEQVIKKKLPL